MLSLFPSFLVYGQMGPMILRVVLGIVFIYWAYKTFKSKENLKDILYALVQVIIGILLIIGLLTQLATVIAGVILVILLVIKIKNKSFLTNGVNYYLILFVISLSLLVMGPGKWAFDLPL